MKNNKIIKIYRLCNSRTCKYIIIIIHLMISISKKNKTFLKLNDFFVICLTAQEYNTILT